MNETIKEELTMNAVPKAVNYLIEEVAEMRATLESIEKQLGLGVNKHRPILIEQAVSSNFASADFRKIKTYNF